MLAAAFTQPSLAAIPVHVVKTDLRPLIRAAVQSPVQFAVPVPHSVSTTSGGTWSSTADGVATWSYAVQVPTAVSLSFHAINSSLPASAVLVVRGAKSTTRYAASDLHRGELWSRIYVGEALQLELSVAAQERSKVALNIASVQAGYRAIGPGVADHPYYRRLKEQAQAADNSSCVTNYECQVTPGNTPSAAATVGLIVGNVYQCTGTLINDVPGDNAPYLLTARHCENGQPGGGNPGAAASVTVYWDATTPCGTALNSFYDGGTTQTGAQTVVEQQDAWLLLLDSNPLVVDAQFAGFDASGGAVQGGYTIHHAEGFDKQFAGWSGQAAVVQQNNVLGVGYSSNFLETVNALGNIGPGASGSALFDQNNHVVGSLTLGRQTADSSGYGMCPVASPPAPNGTNGAADFTALSAIWNSTADTTSTTGSATLQSVLDPGNTGTLTTSSVTPAVQFYTSDIYTLQGSQVQLRWSAQNALQCSASGGISGDGWAGTLPSTSGNQFVTETSVGLVTYTVTCSFPGGHNASNSIRIDWESTEPSVRLSAPYAVWATGPAVLSWHSTFGPCAISGGGLSQSNLPADGTLTTTQGTAGDVTYTVTCGGSLPGTGTATVQYVTPSVILEPTGTDRILGQYFALQWLTYADTCVSSGGAPGDGWAGNSFLGNAPGSSSPPQPPFAPHVTAAGTYTYTLTCTAGPTSVQQSVTVTFENNAPYVTASLSSSSVTYSNSPADYVTVNWNSNVSGCDVITSPKIPDSLSDPLAIPFLSQGSASLTPAGAGSYTISVACSIAGQVTPYTSAPLTLTVLPAAPPTASISVSPNPEVVGQVFTITWSSTNTLSCVRTSDVAAWDVAPDLFPSGTFSNIIWQSGQYTFSISCPSIDPNQGPATAQTQLTVGAITASLSASPATLTTGSTVTITWSSTNATSCTASGGGANGSTWTGSQTASGSVTQTATTAGTFTYEISCVNSNSSNTQATAVTAQQTVTVSGVSASNSGPGGAGHGGSLSWIDLAMLGLIRAAAAAGSSRRSRLRTRNPDSGSRARGGSAR